MIYTVERQVSGCYPTLGRVDDDNPFASNN